MILSNSLRYQVLDIALTDIDPRLLDDARPQMSSDIFGALFTFRIQYNKFYVKKRQICRGGAKNFRTCEG